MSEPANQLEKLINRYLRHLTVERGLAKNSILAYRSDLTEYQRFLEEQSIGSPAEIAETTVLSFLEWLSRNRGLAASSVARILAAVRGLHRFWLIEGVLEVDVAATVKPPKTSRKLPKAIPLAAIEQLLAAAGVLKGRECSAYPACGPEVTLAGGRYMDIAVDQAHVQGNLVTAPAWPAHPNWLAGFLGLLGTKITL